MLDSANDDDDDDDDSESESIQGLYNSSSVASYFEEAAAGNAGSAMRTASVDEAVAASGLYSDNDTLSDDYSSSASSVNSRIPAPYVSASSSDVSEQNTASYSSARSVGDDGEEFGVTTVEGSDAQYKLDANVKFDDYADSVNYSFPKSTRKYADSYPAEAAYADAVGTEMTDIRFINNKSITSKIDTSTVLGYTASGKAFTDVGFSGKGRLGEVVTWADGTQRVEIIGENSSTWLTTSGNLTLDEICDFDCEPGSLVGKLTPFETAIRYWSREYTDAEKQEMTSFEQYVRQLARGFDATVA
jgi:hypothetical protein